MSKRESRIGRQRDSRQKFVIVRRLGIFHHVNIFFLYQVTSILPRFLQITQIKLQGISRPDVKLGGPHAGKRFAVFLASGASLAFVHGSEHIPFDIDDHSDHFTFFVHRIPMKYPG